MTPIELTLWMNATMELVGDGPPSPDQWLMMREKVANTMGTIVAKKLMETAENVLREQEMKNLSAKHMEEMYKLKNQIAHTMNGNTNHIPPPTYAGIMAKSKYGPTITTGYRHGMTGRIA